VWERYCSRRFKPSYSFTKYRRQREGDNSSRILEIRRLTYTPQQLIPAPRGTGLVASPAVKRLLQLAGVQDVYTSSAGSTKTLENTLKATFVAVGNTYGFLTPNLWKDTKLNRSPLEEFGDVLREGKRY